MDTACAAVIKTMPWYHQKSQKVTFADTVQKSHYAPAGTRAIIKVSGHQHRWLVSRWLQPGNRTFLEVESMVVSWWIVAFLYQPTKQWAVSLVIY